MCWGHNPRISERSCMWSSTFTEMVDPTPLWLCPARSDLDTDMYREQPHGEDGCLPVQEKPTLQTLVSDFQPLDCETVNVSCVNPPCVALCYPATLADWYSGPACLTVESAPEAVGWDVSTLHCPSPPHVSLHPSGARHLPGHQPLQQLCPPRPVP